ncbi:hypothetical protein J2790_002015 [Paenarthrobacter nicotinovorans]|uniref:hypothetical protein n=1 Tax=Micrococcaceae TaxID=1268 RepID=UPI0008769A68|nr:MULTISPECIES: hypothetical protein [Micrococcaceae]MDR6436872.1 hypothetical protein [Paenarthrobacter nicotinovorans]SCZ55459.1 hypothetical protein SAMN02799638_01748 [Arthrobacter sp. UNCCL28]
MDGDEKMPLLLQEHWHPTAMACIALLALVGCSSPRMPEVERAEVVGTWTYSASASTVNGDVPQAEIQLNDDNTATVSDFPISQLSDETLAASPFTSVGVWEFQSLAPEPIKFENQPGIELVLKQTDSRNGFDVARRLAIEKKDGEVKLAIYIGYPDLPNKSYVLTKKE